MKSRLVPQHNFRQISVIEKRCLLNLANFATRWRQSRRGRMLVSHNMFLTVRGHIHRCTEMFLAIREANLNRLHKRNVYIFVSCPRDVTYGLPECWRSRTVPICWCKQDIVLIMLIRTLNYLATLFWDIPAYSISNMSRSLQKFIEKSVFTDWLHSREEKNVLYPLND